MDNPPSGNWLLQALHADELDTIFGVSSLRELRAGGVVHQPNVAITEVFFPVTAVFSNVMAMLSGALVEVGTVGWEGLSPIQGILGGDSQPWETVCQIKGIAYSMPMDVFAAKMREESEFVRRVKSFGNANYAIMGQSIACNRLHSIAQRCARWLLMTGDRARSEEFSLTQEFLAVLLGVHRPAVTTAALALQDAGCIKYRHGRIAITNRQSLESQSCECYRVTADQLKRLTVASA